MLGTWAERVRVESDNGSCFREPRAQPQGLTIDRTRRLDVVEFGGFEPMPTKIGKAVPHRRNLFEQGRRGYIARKQPQTRAFVCCMLAHLRPERGFESRPVGDLAGKPDRLRAVRIVEAEDLALREDVRSPEARRMTRVSLDLGWATIEGGNDRPAPITAKRKRGRIALGDSRKQPFRQVHVGQLFDRVLRDNLLVRLLACRSKGSDAAGDHLERRAP